MNVEPAYHAVMVQQITAYLNGRDGLAGNGPDTSPRPKPIPRWSHKKNEPYVPK